MIAATVAAVSWARWAFPQPHRGVLTVIGIIYLLPSGAFPALAALPRPTLLDAAVSVTLAGWLWLTLRRRIRWTITPSRCAVLLFLGVLLAAFAQGLDATVPEQRLACARVVLAVLFFFSVTHGLQNKRQLKQAVAMMVVASGLAASAALTLYLLPVPTNHLLLAGLGWIGYPADDTLVRFVADPDIRRATGTAVDPNLLGGMLAVSLPIALAQGLGPRPVLSRPLVLFIAAIVAVALLLTFSRAAWFGALVGVGLLSLMGYRRIWWGLTVGLIAAAIGPWRARIWERVQTGVLWSDRASLMRIEEYRESLARVLQHPGFGVGFGTPPGMDPLLRVSNAYLLIAEQSGLLGLMAFITIPVLILGQAIPAMRAGPTRDHAAIQAGALAALCAALAIGLFDHYFFNYGFPQTVTLFWFIAALAAWPASLKSGG